MVMLSVSLSLLFLEVVLSLQHQALIPNCSPTREQIPAEHLQAPQIARTDPKGVLYDVDEGRLVRLDGAGDAAQHFTLQFFCGSCMEENKRHGIENQINISRISVGIK